MRRRTACAAFLGSFALGLTLLSAPAMAEQTDPAFVLQEESNLQKAETEENIQSARETKADFILKEEQASYAMNIVTDDADLFTDDEIEKMNEISRTIKEKFGLDTFVITWDYDAETPAGYSDNYARDLLCSYGEENYPDGYLAFGIHMADRSFFIDGYGSQITEEFPVSVTEDMAEDAQDKLADGEYGVAAIEFLDETEKRLEIIRTPMGFLKKPLLYPAAALATFGLALVIAAAIALLATYVQVKKHEDKKISLMAPQYGQNFSLTNSRDTFFRHYQTRVPRPKENSSSGGGGISSSSGGGHSGSGGHF